MQRTTVMLPDELKSKAFRLAAALGVSFGELVRDTLGERVEKAAAAGRDPFFDDEEVYTGPYPAEGIASLDDVVYGEHP